MTASEFLVVAGTDKAVAPEYPSGPTSQTISPEILLGYEKNMKHRAVKAGLNMFIPTPPKISLPMTIPKEVAIKSCHKGIDGGIVSGINAHVTKNPSEISCFLTMANNISQNAPAMKVTAIIGTIVIAPKMRLPINDRSIPRYRTIINW